MARYRAATAAARRSGVSRAGRPVNCRANRSDATRCPTRPASPTVPSRTDPASSTVVAAGNRAIASSAAGSSCPSNRSTRGAPGTGGRASGAAGALRVTTVRLPVRSLTRMRDTGVGWPGRNSSPDTSTPAGYWAEVRPLTVPFGPFIFLACGVPLLGAVMLVAFAEVPRADLLPVAQDAPPPQQSVAVPLAIAVPGSTPATSTAAPAPASTAFHLVICPPTTLSSICWEPQHIE